MLQSTSLRRRITATADLATRHRRLTSSTLNRRLTNNRRQFAAITRLDARQTLQTGRDSAVDPRRDETSVLHEPAWSSAQRVAFCDECAGAWHEGVRVDFDGAG